MLVILSTTTNVVAFRRVVVLSFLKGVNRLKQNKPPCCPCFLTRCAVCCGYIKSVFMMEDDYFMRPDMMPEPPELKDLTPEERAEVMIKSSLFGCCSYVVIAIIAVLLCLILGGCATQRIVSDETTERHTQEMLQQMDSLLRVRSVVQQDSTWQREVLRQFQSIREKSDTSHFVVTDTSGHVIREKIVINNTREVTSETDRERLTVMARRLEVLDSTVQAQNVMLQRMDSLLNKKQQAIEHEEEKPARTQLSRWQTFRLWLGNMVLIFLTVFIGWWVLKKKLPWL